MLGAERRRHRCSSSLAAACTMHEMTIRLIAVLLLVAAGVAQAAAPALPGAEWMLDQVKLLSAPEMEGRGSGTAGAERAARHIADLFRAAGLRPGGDGGRTYLQAFSVPTGTRLGAVNTLALLTPTARAFTLGTDFTPLGVSTDGAAEGEIVFAGYGITAPDLQYDDYAGLRGAGPHRDRAHRRSARGRSRQPLSPPGGVPLLAADAQDHQRARARRPRHPARRASTRARRRSRPCAASRRPTASWPPS